MEQSINSASSTHTQRKRPTVDIIRLRPEADQYIQNASAIHAALLVRLAGILAVRDQADEVQSIHAEKASAILGDLDTRSIRRETMILLGGALFGAFLQGFTDAVTAEHLSALKIVTYAGFGMLGVVLALWGLLRR